MDVANKKSTPETSGLERRPDEIEHRRFLVQRHRSGAVVMVALGSGWWYLDQQDLWRVD